MTSSSRRKSSQRGEYDDDPTFASAITAEPSEISDRTRGGTRKDKTPESTRRKSGRSERSSRDERSRGDAGDRGFDDSPRDSGKSSRSRRKDSTRALDENTPSLPQNQFPGEFPTTYAEPYRPPGLASEYYGDLGESVQFQPGVRPNQPNIVTNAEQAHLMEPTQEAKPPPEPSSIGQLGAAASYFGSAGYESESGHQTTPSKPPKTSGSGSTRPPKHSSYGASPRASPIPQGNNFPQYGQASGAMAFSVPAAVAVGEAAEYYAGGGGGGSVSAYQTPTRPPAVSHGSGAAPYSAPAGVGGSQSHSNAALYGGAAALAGATAGAYLSSHSHDHHSSSQHYAMNQTSASQYHQTQGTQMHQMHRHSHKGVFGRFVDWWRDPEAIAQYEQYTQAIGVCKYCFDPMSSPADAPRKHHYHPQRRSSGSRHGSSNRVDKTYRYSSDEDVRRRSSTTKKMVLGGVAGYGVAKVGEAIYKRNHDFDDTYSVKSGRPVNQSRVSFQDEPQYERYGDVRLSRRGSDRSINKTAKISQKSDDRRRRYSSSSSSTSSSRRSSRAHGAASEKKSRRRSKSRTPSPTARRKYFSKRVSPMHSYVDLSATNDGPGGLIGFFTSPSANQKRGKKPKGFFNFANDSSSSSDADLRFGEGTVRRKSSRKQLREARDRRGHGGGGASAAALAGLVVAGTKLAAETDKEHNRGKRKTEADKRAGRNARDASNHRIILDDHEHGGRDDGWYTDAESEESVDIDLAYGGGVSAVQSRESLADHKPNYNFREEDQRRYHESLGRQRYGVASSSSVPAAPMAAATDGNGAMGGWNSTSASTRNSMGQLAPMQVLDPKPVSDPPSTAVSPYDSRVSSTIPPLQQPQPVIPVAPFINGIGSHGVEPTEETRRRASRDSRRARRDSSPAKLPSQDPRSSVNFELNDEQLDDERRAAERRARRERESNDRASKKNAMTESTSRDAKTRGRRSSEASRKPADDDERVAEIEKELERLYEEHRQAEERKRKRDSGLKKVAAGAAIGTAAVVAAGVLAGKDGKNSSGEDSAPKRKSSLKKKREKEESPPAETQQERIARMAAQRVGSVSPVQHDSYDSFFVPVEIREHLKEHNDKSEHREDIGATVVEIVPGAPKPSKPEPFDPFTYRQFGLELEHDPLLQPWPVPTLALIEPTPPGSRTHSLRGDQTPVIEPNTEEAAEEIGEPLERRESKVTWGDHDTYVYEVQTPEYERTDYVHTDIPTDDTTSPDAPSRPGVGRTWTLDEAQAETLEKEVPVVEDRPRISRAWTVDDNEADQIDHNLPATDQDRKSAARESSAVAEPEELPPGADTNGHARASYHSPFEESFNGDGGDIDDFENAAEEPLQSKRDILDRNEVEDAEPQDVAVAPTSRATKSEKRRRERANSSVERVRPSTTEPHGLVSESDATAPPPLTGNDSVFDYLEKNGESMATVSAVGLGASAILAADRSAEAQGNRVKTEDVDTIEDAYIPAKPKRSTTYDDSRLQRSRSDSRTDYHSDPEEWERSTDKQTHGAKSRPKSDVGTKGSSREKDRRRTGDDAEFVPLPSSPTADDFEEDKGSRRSSRRNKDGDEESTVSRRSKDDERKARHRRSKDGYGDDDSRSVATSTSDSKGKKKEAGGFLSNLFSSNKSDVSTSSKKSSKSSKSESRADRDRDDRSESRKKRRSTRDKADFDDVASAVSEPIRRSRRSSDSRGEAPDKHEIPRDQSVDDGFMSAEEDAGTPLKDTAKDESFLASRPEMPKPMVMDIPMDTDGVSGPISERNLSTEQHVDAGDKDVQALAKIPSFDPAAAPDNESESHPIESSPAPADFASSRRLSAIRTGDIPSSPIPTSSPTAVPLHFRRPPVSPTSARFVMSSPGAPPASPLTTPRTRQGRPKSTEFRNSKEFRPLYLVERRNFAKNPTLEPDEDLPSLPSSKTSSAHPSMEDLRAEAQAQEQEYFNPSRISAEMIRNQGRRHSYSYWHDDDKRRESPDYLDSRSATPVPGEVQRAREKEKKPKPKYEFHSPSELLQDPASFQGIPAVDDADPPQSPLPSVASTELDQDYMSARSRSLSPERARSMSRGRRSASTTRSTSSSWHDALTTAAVGTLAGSALGFAAHEVLKETEDNVPADEPETPKKHEFSSAEGIPPEPQHRDVQEDSAVPVLPAADQVSLEKERSVLPPDDSPESGAEPVRDTGAWRNVFAEIQNRKRKVDRPTDASVPPPDAGPDSSAEPVRDTGAWGNIFAEIQNRKPKVDRAADPSSSVPVDEARAMDEVAGPMDTALSTSPDAAPLPEDHDTPAKEAADLDLLEEKSPETMDSVSKRQDWDVQPPAPELTGKSKKSKKDKKSKKKRAAFAWDEDQPSTPDETATPEETVETPELSREVSTVAESIPLERDTNEPVVTEAQQPQPVEREVDEPIQSQDLPSGIAEDSAPIPAPPSTIVETPVEQISFAQEESQHDSAEMIHPASPLEAAFAAAIHARGLTEGATADEAYQSFQPEIPDTGGTPLTTIQEETEIPTPAPEDDQERAESEAKPDRKMSKKEKRKKAKANQSAFNDFPAEESSKLDSQSEQARDIEIGDRSPPDERVLAEPTPTEERPNPFGNDFEVKSEDASVTPAAAAEGELPRADGEDEDSSLTTTKKGKKDKKKKKRQSSNWEEEATEIQAAPVQDISATDPDAQTATTMPSAADDSISTPQEPVVEDVFATPVETPQQESEDPWEMTSKPGKKKKSKSKKKSTPFAFEEASVPTAEAPSFVTAPTAETFSMADEPSEAVFADQVVDEPTRDETLTPTAMPPSPEPTEVSHQVISSEADDVFEESRQAPSPDAAHLVTGLENNAPAPMEAVDAGQARSLDENEMPVPHREMEFAAAGAAAFAGAFLAASSPGKGEASEEGEDKPELEHNDQTKATIAAPEEAPRELVPTEDVNVLSETSKDPGVEEHITSTVPDVSSRKEDESMEQPETEVAATHTELEDTARQAPASLDQRDAEDNVASTPDEHPVDIQIPQSQQDEDVFPLSTKKSKKQKKKKRASVFDDEETATPTSEGTAAEELPTTDATTGDREIVEPARSEPVESSASIPATPAEDGSQQDTDFFSFSNKRDKKGKKKKRQSTFAGMDTPASASDTPIPDDKTTDTPAPQPEDIAEVDSTSIPMTVEPESDPTQDQDVSHQDEAVLSAPTKKSKKEKKKKRTTLTFDDFDQATPLQDAGNDAESANRQPDETVAADTATATVVSTAAGDAEPEPEPALNPAENVSREIDDTAASSKKSKKSKKDKKKRLTFTDDFEETPGSSDAAQENTASGLTAEPAVEQFAEPGTITEEPREAEQTAEVADKEAPVPDAENARAPPSTYETPGGVLESKVPLQDIPLADNSEENPLPSQNSAPENLADKTEIFESPATELPVTEGSAIPDKGVDLPITQPSDDPTLAISNLAPAEQADAHIDEPISVEPSAMEPDVAASVIPESREVEHASDQPTAMDISADDRSDLEPQALDTATVETPTVEIPAVETPAVETPAVETPVSEEPVAMPGGFETPAEEEWNVPVKKSKKDKKKKQRQSTLDVGAEEPEPGKDADIPISQEPSSVEADISTQDNEGKTDEPKPAIETPAEEEWNVPVKKSKKDKKGKKRQPTLNTEANEPEPGKDADIPISQEPIPAEADISIPGNEAMIDEPKPDIDEVVETRDTSTRDPSMPASDEVAAEEEWAFTSTKSKKDKKKKKRQSEIANLDEMGDTVEASKLTVEAPESTEPIGVDSLKDSPEEPEVIVQEEARPSENDMTDVNMPPNENIPPNDEPEFTSTRSKKDKKKKKRQSARESTPFEAAADESTDQQPFTDNMEPPLAESPQVAEQGEEADAENGPTTADDFTEDQSATVSKKKKKDKKKGRSSRLEEFVPPVEAEQETSRAFPLEETTPNEALNDDGAKIESLDPAEASEQILTPAEPTETLPSTNLESETGEDFELSRKKSKTGKMKKRQSVFEGSDANQSAETPVPEEEAFKTPVDLTEEDWSTPSTAKSKKSKKSKRDSRRFESFDGPTDDISQLTVLDEPKPETESLPQSTTADDVPMPMEIDQPEILRATMADIPLPTETLEVSTQEEPLPESRPQLEDKQSNDAPMIMDHDEPRAEEEVGQASQKELLAEEPQVAAQVFPQEEPTILPQDSLSTIPSESRSEALQVETTEPASHMQSIEATPPTETLAPDEVDQPSVEPSTAEPTDADEWAMPSKKSKKKKSKRQSTIDEAAIDTPQPEIAKTIPDVEAAEPDVITETGPPAADDIAPVDSLATEEIAAEDWTSSSKKSKKDKKKKRRTLLADDDSQPVTPGEEKSLEEATRDVQQPTSDVPVDTFETANQLPEVLTTTGQADEDASAATDKGKTEDMTPLAGQESAPPTASAPAIEEDWAVPVKKSKKDKKAKKQRASLDVFDVDMSEPAPPTDVVPAEIASVQPEADPILAKLTNDEINQDAAGPVAFPEHFLTDQPESTLEEVQVEPDTVNNPLEAERGFDAAIDEPTAIESDFAPAKKSKKEKRKSKRQSTFDESSIETKEKAVEETKLDEVIDKEAADTPSNEQPVAETIPSEKENVDEWAFSTKKSKKKSKKGTPLATPGVETPMSTDQFESAAQTPMERTASPEPMQDIKAEDTTRAPPEPATDSYFTAIPSKKKSKKDKKKKTMLDWANADEPTSEATSEAVTPAPLHEQEIHKDTGTLAGEHIDAEPSPPKGVAETIDIPTSREILPEDEMIARPTSEREYDVEMATPPEQPTASHHHTISDRQGNLNLADDPEIPDRFEYHADERPREMEVDSVQIGHRLDDVPRNTEMPAQEDYHPMLEPSSTDQNMEDVAIMPTPREANVIAPGDQPQATLSEVQRHESTEELGADPSIPDTGLLPDAEDSPKRKKSKKDKKAKKDRRVFEFDGTETVEPPIVEPELEETRELDVMDTIPEESVEPPPALVESQHPEDVEHLSDVSETTRERRRRRRSPPAWSGEEPADLPRGGALTPPPDHNDIMDTALGVAAGLGFGGGNSESTRQPFPKPRSPARQPSAGWSFAKLGPGIPESNRDSGVQFESPVVGEGQFSATRDSGFIPSPAVEPGEFPASRNDSLEIKLRPPRPQSPTSSTEDVSKPRVRKTAHEEPALLETPRRKPSPVESTTKDRSSALFNSSPAVPSPLITTGLSRSPEPSKSPLHRSPSVHGHHHSREELRQQKSKAALPHGESDLASNLIDRSAVAPVNRSGFDLTTPAKSSLTAIREDSAHPFSDPPVSLTPQHHPGHDDIGAAGAIAGAAAVAGIVAAGVSSRDSGAKSLGRSKSRTSSLRNLRGSSVSPFDPNSFASSSSQEPVNARSTGKTAVRDRDMEDVYVSFR